MSVRRASVPGSTLPFCRIDWSTFPTCSNRENREISSTSDVFGSGPDSALSGYGKAQSGPTRTCSEGRGGPRPRKVRISDRLENEKTKQNSSRSLHVYNHGDDVPGCIARWNDTMRACRHLTLLNTTCPIVLRADDDERAWPIEFPTLHFAVGMTPEQCTKALARFLNASSKVECIWIRKMPTIDWRRLAQLMSAQARQRLLTIYCKGVT